jgi:hypothetical protein
LNGPQLPNVETNAAGIAAFHLPDPLPGGRPSLISPFIDICSKRAVSLDQVLSKGEAGENNCGAAKFSENPNPGELVIFGRRLNVFQRIWNLLLALAHGGFPLMPPVCLLVRPRFSGRFEFAA